MKKRIGLLLTVVVVLGIIGTIYVSTLNAGTSSHEAEASSNKFKYSSVKDNYVEFDEKKDAYVEMKNINSADSGSATLTFVYSATKSFPVEVKVNGSTIVSKETFDSTGGSWKEKSITATMNSGNDNKIKFKIRAAVSGIKLDKVTINTGGSSETTTTATVEPKDEAEAVETEAVETETSTQESNSSTVNTEDGLIGWATADGGTTGGGDKKAVTVKSSSELKNLVKGTNSEVIYVSGKIGGSYSIGSNKTIIGLSGAEIGNVTLKGSSNVIMRNLKLSGGEDTVSISSKSHHLWFDHLDMCDSNDETLSITHGSNYITVSWCKYWFTRSGDHRFGGLVGHSDSNSSEDSGKLKVTYHHNWYSDKVIERMPRVRFGQVHVFNNLFESNDTNYAIRCGVDANILSEKNVFIDQKKCFDLNNSNSNAVLQSIDDLFVGSCGSTTGKGGSAFNPPYNYSTESTNGLAEKIRSGAGATLK